MASSCDKLQDNLALAAAKPGVAQDALRKIVDDAVDGNQKAKQRFAELVCLKPEEAQEISSEGSDLFGGSLASPQAGCGSGTQEVYSFAELSKFWPRLGLSESCVSFSLPLSFVLYFLL